VLQYVGHGLGHLDQAVLQPLEPPDFLQDFFVGVFRQQSRDFPMTGFDFEQKAIDSFSVAASRR
jgi:hypothetical protein